LSQFPDSASTRLRTVVKASQVLDAKGKKAGCPQRRARLTYYDYLEQGILRRQPANPAPRLAGGGLVRAAASRTVRPFTLDGGESTMLTLVIGLVLFLGIHSVRVFADGWRTATIARVGELPWKGIYSLASIAGIVLVVVGYGLARQNPVVLWNQPPVGMRHVAALLTLVAFVLIAAAYVPRNQIKARLHHPMILGVKVWALAHLIANNTLADLVLFGGFLLWAVLDFRAARKRDRSLVTAYPAGTASGTAIAVAVGAIAWAVFAFWLHRLMTGVPPMGV
jgi:uncharacterized membrane protein